MKSLFDRSPQRPEDLARRWRLAQGEGWDKTQRAIWLAWLEWQPLDGESLAPIFAEMVAEARPQTWARPVVDWWRMPESGTGGAALELAIAAVAAAAGAVVVKRCGTRVAALATALKLPFAPLAGLGASAQTRPLTLVRLAEYSPSMGVYESAAAHLPCAAYPERLAGLLPLGSPAKLVVSVSRPERLRQLEPLLAQSQPDTALLYDESGSGLFGTSLHAHWWQTNQRQTLRLADWGLPCSDSGWMLLAQRRNLAEEARYLEQLLRNQATPSETALLLLNAGLLLQCAQPKLQPSGALAQAEAALTSGQAWRLLTTTTA